MATNKTAPNKEKKTTAAPAQTPQPQRQDRIEFVDDNLKHGFAQIPRPVLRASWLSDRAKVLYALLLDYAWQNDNCFPGQDRLARDMGKSVDTVQRALNELRDYRLVDWKQQGLNSPNIYYILRLSDCCFLHPDTILSGTPQKCGIQKPHFCGIQKPQKCGTNNTQSKDTQKNNTQSTSRKGTALKNKKGTAELNGTYSHIAAGTIGNGKTNVKRGRPSSKVSKEEHAGDTSLSQIQTNGKPSDKKSNENPGLSMAGPPLTQDELDRQGRGARAARSGELTPLSDIIPASHWQVLARQQQNGQAPALPNMPAPGGADRQRQGQDRPSTPGNSRVQGHWKQAPLFIQATIAEWFSREMHDQAIHSTITRVHRIYKRWVTTRPDLIEQETREDTFYTFMQEARSKSKRATIKTRTPSGQPNRTPYFLTCLEDLSGLKAPVPEATPQPGNHRPIRAD
jgi:hypothetical protein